MKTKPELQKQTSEAVKEMNLHLGYLKHNASLHDEVVENAK